MRQVTALAAGFFWVLGFSFSSVAQAADVTVSSGNPAIFFEETDEPSFVDEWIINGASDFFTIFSNEGTLPVFFIKQDAKSSGMTLNSFGLGIGGLAGSDIHVLDTVPSLRLEDTDATAGTGDWVIVGDGTAFDILDLDASGITPIVRIQPGASTNSLVLSAGGDVSLANGDLLWDDSAAQLAITGTLSVSSDVNAKQDIRELPGSFVLARLEQMPVSQWSYKSDPETRHIGPMAQDFHKAFGLGNSDKHISPTDMAGVNMAAIKAQQEKIRMLEAANARLAAAGQARIAELEARLAALEAKLAK